MIIGQFTAWSEIYLTGSAKHARTCVCIRACVGFGQGKVQSNTRFQLLTTWLKQVIVRGKKVICKFCAGKNNNEDEEMNKSML